MSNYPSCSLITPTYNWPEALELLLLSVKQQSYLPNEVIIADDGSKVETQKLIQKYQQDFPIPLIHIWHDDNKNRKPAIMNKGTRPITIFIPLRAPFLKDSIRG